VLAQIREKDKSNFDDFKDRVEIDFRKDKKAEMLLEKVNTAMTGATKLQDIGTKLQVPVTPITAQTFENNNIAYVGPDNLMVGAIFGTTSTGKIIGPVKGDNGVYVYSLTKFNPAPAIQDYSQYKNEIQMQLSQRLESGSLDALKDIKNVKDNRFMFY
jgi:peptidyl-prolyl cis-trans isomerase D